MDGVIWTLFSIPILVKKDLYNLCVDSLLFDLIEIRAFLNEILVFVSNQEYSAI